MIVHKNSFLQGYDAGLEEAARCEGFGNLNNTDWSPLPNNAMWKKLCATQYGAKLEQFEDKLILIDMNKDKWAIKMTGDKDMPIEIELLERA